MDLPLDLMGLPMCWIMIISWCFVGSPAVSREFDLSFSPHGLVDGRWANEGTLGSDYDIDSLSPGTIETVDFHGKNVNALCFENSEDVCTMDFDLNQPEVTIAAWVRTDYLLDTTFLLTNDDGGWDRIISFKHNGCFGGIGLGGTGGCYGSTLGYPPIGEWIHVVATWSEANNEAVIYVNGGEVAGGQQQTRSPLSGASSRYTITGINRSFYYEISRYGVEGYSIEGCFAQIQAAYHVVSADEVASVYNGGELGQEPTAKPTTAEPSTAEPSARPTTASPTTAEPTTAMPTTASPTKAPTTGLYGALLLHHYYK